MDTNPIQEKKTWQEIVLEKFKKFGKQFTKPKKPDYNKLLDELSKNQKEIVCNLSDFSLSCDKAGRAIAEFGKVLTPNQTREICDLQAIDDETTLYADGKPYCIINRKGEVVWQKNIE